MARGGTPLGFSAPSLDTSYQAQIDDLVQRNRTLEHTKQKLSEQVTHENSRSKEAIVELQRQWQIEKAEWREGCDVLQSCHRVVQLRNVVEIEKERINVLKELDAARKEKLLRLQRDFRITMFQAREAELEDRIRELEEESDAKVAALEENARRLKARNAEFVAQIQANDRRLSLVEEEKEELHGRLTDFQLQYTRLQANADKLATSLERTTLQYDSAVTARDDLKRANEELKRLNADMLRQIDKWQTLENKGGAEVEAQRKKRIELEVQVKDLQVQMEKAAEEYEKSVEKEKRKVDKLKTGVQEWQAESEKYEQESEDAQRRLAKAEKQIAKLKDALEIERSQVRPPSLEKQRAPSPLIPVDEDEDEVVQPPAKRNAQNKAPPKARAEPDNAEAGPSDARTGETTKPAGKKRKAKVTAADIEEQVPTGKPKSKPTSRRKASPVPEEPGSDVEEVPPQKAKPKSKGKGKAKAVNEPGPMSENEVEIVGAEELRGTKRKADSKADSEVAEVMSAPRKPARKRPSKSTRAGSELRDVGTAKAQRKTASAAESDTEKEPPAKKKRKINIFPTNVKPTAFDFMPNIDGGLNIPTALSPVKETDAVPSRSTSGVIGSIGSMLRNSFTRR